MSAPEIRHGRNAALEAAANNVLSNKAPERYEIEKSVAAALAEALGWRTATQRAFQHFAEAGRLLKAQKASLKHGQWQEWLLGFTPAEYYMREHSDPGEAWRRTATNWMRIADIVDHCSPELIESAQTVSQLFRLAQFLPEGVGQDGGTDLSEMPPAEIVHRLKRWLGSNAQLLDVSRLITLPREERTNLRAQLAPFAAAWEALS